ILTSPSKSEKSIRTERLNAHLIRLVTSENSDVSIGIVALEEAHMALPAISTAPPQDDDITTLWVVNRLAPIHIGSSIQLPCTTTLSRCMKDSINKCCTPSCGGRVNINTSSLTNKAG